MSQPDIGVFGKSSAKSRGSPIWKEVWLLEPSECAWKTKVGAEVTDKEP